MSSKTLTSLFFQSALTKSSGTGYKANGKFPLEWLTCRCKKTCQIHHKVQYTYIFPIFSPMMFPYFSCISRKELIYSFGSVLMYGKLPIIGYAGGPGGKFLGRRDEKYINVASKINRVIPNVTAEFKVASRILNISILLHGK